MAPFPEDETITIKRLDYALKHSDYRLLREGAYKLHEKYHSHHHFQYTDLLREILYKTEENQAVPPEVKEILISTIKDILNDNNDETQSRVSGLTSLSYEINPKPQQTTQENDSIQNIEEDAEEEAEEYPEDTKEESYIKPFQEFTPIKPIELVENSKKNENPTTIVEKYNEQPTEDFITDTPIVQQQNIFENEKNIEEEIPQYFVSEQNEPEEETKEDIVEYQDTQEEQENEIIKVDTESEEISEETDDSEENLYMNEYEEEISNEEQKSLEETEEYDSEEAENIEDGEEETVFKYNVENKDKDEDEDENENKIESEVEIQDEAEPQEEENTAIEQQKKITIFYSQNSSNEKIANILKYRELLYDKKDFSLSEITKLINEIKMQADTNVSELQIFLDKLKPTKHKLNLITNSQSVNLIDMLIKSDITYSIFDNDADKKINILPILGLTNLYKCCECDREYLDINEKINSFILQCPKCKNAMLPELYTLKGDLNMDFYNSSIVTLANSDTWLLIHPSLNEKLTFNMIKSAIQVSTKLKEVYILDKDINVKEAYKRIFEEFNPEVKVSCAINAMEEFFNNI